MKWQLKSLVLACTMISFHSAYGAVSAEQAAELGKSLTPWGAIQAGNAEGTIPAYTGRPTVHPNYDPKKPGVRPDLFEQEQPLFVITAANVEQYGDKVSPGTKEMLKKYPQYKLNVYPSHRTANYPDWANVNSIKNATECKAVNDNLGVEGCHAGVPFPIPQNGDEVMWNKILQLEGPSNYGVGRSVFIDPNGKVIVQGENLQNIDMPYWDKDRTATAGGKDIYWRYRIVTTAPARKAGEGILIHDSLDMTNVGRRAWQYIPGQRRVKLTPDMSYDTPNPHSGGTSNMDDATLFLGALDRFDFTLVGKQEMFIPYNDFKFKNANYCSQEKALTKNIVNPECSRWELHRVWVVEAKLKSGARHNYSTRRFYLDEDVFTGIAENYDAAGQLYRVVQTGMVPRYESVGHDVYTTTNYDIPSGAYVMFNYTAPTGGTYDTPKQPDRFWSPDNLSGSSIR